MGRLEKARTRGAMGADERGIGMRGGDVGGGEDYGG